MNWNFKNSFVTHETTRVWLAKQPLYFDSDMIVAMIIGFFIGIAIGFILGY